MKVCLCIWQRSGGWRRCPLLELFSWCGFDWPQRKGPLPSSLQTGSTPVTSGCHMFIPHNIKWKFSLQLTNYCVWKDSWELSEAGGLSSTFTDFLFLKKLESYGNVSVTYNFIRYPPGKLPCNLSEARWARYLQDAQLTKYWIILYSQNDKS